MRLIVGKSQGMVLESFLSPYTSQRFHRSSTVGMGKEVDQEEHTHQSADTPALIQQHPFLHIMVASGTGLLLRSIYNILLSFHISGEKKSVFSSFKIRETILIAMVPTEIKSNLIGHSIGPCRKKNGNAGLQHLENLTLHDKEKRSVINNSYPIEKLKMHLKRKSH